MTHFEKFINGIKETPDELFGFVFKVERGIITEEFRSMMKIEGFTDEEIDYRYVEVPGRVMKLNADEENITEEDILNLIFHWGQNDFQPKKSPSLSVGDIINFLGKKYRVEPIGFKEIK